MYYIKNGLGKNWVWLGGAFAVFGALAGFGIGNGVQANSVADALAPANTAVAARTRRRERIFSVSMDAC